MQTLKSVGASTESCDSPLLSVWLAGLISEVYVHPSAAKHGIQPLENPHALENFGQFQ